MKVHFFLALVLCALVAAVYGQDGSECANAADLQAVTECGAENAPADCDGATKLLECLKPKVSTACYDSFVSQAEKQLGCSSAGSFTASVTVATLLVGIAFFN